ncbi:unnamed protein product [Mytilus coruscus]|uniref:Reverse transcriptase domain-containing protein n=1 Tax=Mytilus coruscus TaxID=42192 RepID=A0A6J8D7G9_MYTCO|nr:unnamed protein product [Mytilus coruscus]
MTNEQSDSILNMPLDTLEQAVLEQVHEFLNDAAVTCASNKPRYKAKPKLNVWSPDIKLALDEIRKYYAQWLKNLATPEESTVLENRQYYQKVEYDIGLITEIVKDKNIQPATLEELQKAIKSFNKGKSADIYEITVEHILHAGKNLEWFLLNLISIIFKKGKVPEMLKEGLLTPVGITVLPVLNKVIETIVKVRINPAVLVTQNVTQQGFTAGSGPANAALPVEEIYRKAKDNNQEYELVLLDAKSAFDVVIHSHLMKRLYHAGIDDKHWTIIQSMHTDATSAVKWNGQTSELFNVLQGVRQGGILSTDLYKLYINPLLNMLETSNLACRIGNILCNTSACADDVALISKKTTDMQVQINMANTFAGMEGYKLQPKKKHGYKHQT